MIAAYIRRHHVGFLALFIALGGTSYAAAKLPKNSVGTTQIRASAVTEAKLARSVRAKLATSASTVAGPAGPAGAVGPTGATGAAGSAGTNGVDGAAGSNGEAAIASVGIGGNSSTVLPTAGTPLTGVAAATVTLPRAGQIYVEGTGTFSLTCGAGTCLREFTVLVDGQAVPGAFATMLGTASTAQTRTIYAAGVLANAAAGTHSVRIAQRTSGTINSIGESNDARVVALGIAG